MARIIHSKSSETSPEKSGPCLIAGFHQLSEGFPDYWNYSRVGDSVASVDMVRLKLSMKNGGKEWISEHAQTFQCDDFSGWTSKIKPGAWHELLSFGLGDSSMAMGLGQFEPSCKLNAQRGFMEFNPNKVAGDGRFWDLLAKVEPWVAGAELVRFDFAYDVRKPRCECMLTKDRRMYKAVVSNGITEYLGVKNTPGYVKVYDKAKESGLAGELTRIELTCAGEWDADELRKHWPQVHGWTNEGASAAPSRSSDWLRVMGTLFAEMAQIGHPVEQLVSTLNWKQKRYVREFLRTPLVELPEGVPEAVIAEAKSWCSLGQKQTRDGGDGREVRGVR